MNDTEYVKLNSTASPSTIETEDVQASRPVSPPQSNKTFASFWNVKRVSRLIFGSFLSSVYFPIKIQYLYRLETVSPPMVSQKFLVDLIANRIPLFCVGALLLVMEMYWISEEGFFGFIKEKGRLFMNTHVKKWLTKLVS